MFIFLKAKVGRIQRLFDNQQALNYSVGEQS